METHCPRLIYRYERRRPPPTEVGGLVVGALGIAILWASGVEFPFAVPPGLVILLAGALFVGLV